MQCGKYDELGLGLPRLVADLSGKLCDFEHYLELRTNIA